MSIIMGATTSSGASSGGIPLNITITPNSSYKTTLGGGTAQTSQVTASSSNGVGPFNYVWSYISGDSTFVLIPSGDPATVRWEGTVTISQMRFATWRCTVTDSLGNTGYKDLTVYIMDVSFEGGGPII